jgi:hypothetical protein
MRAVHDKTYDRLGHEDLSDLLGVCRPCHDFLGGAVQLLFGGTIPVRT